MERAILAGDTATGVCLMQLEEGLDTGPVYACRTVPIESTTTARALRQQLVEVGTELLVAELRAGFDVPRPQIGEATNAAKVRSEELQIDWTKPPTEVDRLVRLGGAWTMLHGRRLKINAADLVEPGHEPSNELRGDRVAGVRLVAVQPEGRAPMSFEAFARGARLADVEPLGATNTGSVSER